VGILGTSYLTDAPLYPRALAARGIDAELPTRDGRYLVNAIIFDELVNGVVKSSSRKEYIRVIEGLAARGATRLRSCARRFLC
jgi:aspartate racemase